MVEFYTPSWEEIHNDVINISNNILKATFTTTNNDNYSSIRIGDDDNPVEPGTVRWDGNCLQIWNGERWRDISFCFHLWYRKLAWSRFYV